MNRSLMIYVDFRIFTYNAKPFKIYSTSYPMNTCGLRISPRLHRRGEKSFARQQMGRKIFRPYRHLLRLSHTRQTSNGEKTGRVLRFDEETMEHEKYMRMALRQAREALSAGEFPVGCVMVYDGEVVASGRRSNSVGRPNEIDHAEILALRALLADDRSLDLGRVTVYSTMEPCLMCYATMLVNGIRRFVFSYEDAMGGGTNLPLPMLSPLYSGMNVTIVGEVLRNESLALFKEFFSSPDCEYLQSSLLATYTLNQQM